MFSRVGPRKRKLARDHKNLQGTIETAARAIRKRGSLINRRISAEYLRVARYT